MNFKSALLYTALLATHTCYATIANGNFEDWTNGDPDSWSTIDSGITVSEASGPVKNGDLAAQVDVTTTSQGSTDLRQTVSVTSGETYDFSVWVYHTEGSVRARLYIDGYIDNYTDESITDEWQELSYSYSPGSSGDIEVGLRFYDQSGFDGNETVYIDYFTPTDSDEDESEGEGEDDSTSTEETTDESSTTELSDYYSSAEGLSGYDLKTALYEIISGHDQQSYNDVWSFVNSSDIDDYYEDDGSILDIYSESPSGSDSYNFTASSDQCGSYSGEGDCYNREHILPQSWFGSGDYPMYSDVHNLFATDGYVNGRRSSYPHGEVSSTSYTSDNGSKLGSSASSSYSGTVFEPIDEFKGDVARAYFYMATRYETSIDSWENSSTNSDAMLDGSEDQVFEDWALATLISWHESDPVSQKELDRNEAAYSFQGNRNPFIDYPDFVSEIWE